MRLRVFISVSLLAMFVAGCGAHGRAQGPAVRAALEMQPEQKITRAAMLTTHIKAMGLPDAPVPQRPAQRLLLLRDQAAVNPYYEKGPSKWRAYCNRNAPDCEVRSKGMITPLTHAVWRALQEVNQHINARIYYTPDQKNGQGIDKWVRPIVSGNGFVAGDCEDYVLAKRFALMQRGFPAGALRFTLVARGNSQHADHAVLVVATDFGDFVLDNVVDGVRPVEATSYRYISMHVPKPSDPHRFRHTLPRPQPIEGAILGRGV